MKKTWTSPRLKSYGSVAELTQGGCKDIGGPGDGYFMRRTGDPLASCS